MIQGNVLLLVSLVILQTMLLTNQCASSLVKLENSMTLKTLKNAINVKISLKDVQLAINQIQDLFAQLVNLDLV